MSRKNRPRRVHEVHKLDIWGDGEGYELHLAYDRDDGWTAIYRLIGLAGRLVVGEVRVLPTEELPDDGMPAGLLKNLQPGQALVDAPAFATSLGVPLPTSEMPRDRGRRRPSGRREGTVALARLAAEIYAEREAAGSTTILEDVRRRLADEGHTGYMGEPLLSSSRVKELIREGRRPPQAEPEATAMGEAPFLAAGDAGRERQRWDRPPPPSPVERIRWASAALVELADRLDSSPAGGEPLLELARIMEELQFARGQLAEAPARKT